jgi:hypothetical protein
MRADERTCRGSKERLADKPRDHRKSRAEDFGKTGKDVVPVDVEALQGRRAVGAADLLWHPVVPR